MPEILLLVILALVPAAGAFAGGMLAARSIRKLLVARLGEPD